MNKLYHAAVIPPPNLHESYFDETLNDVVYTRLRCFFGVVYMDQNHISVGEAHWINLPPPDPNNFIPFANVDFKILRSWVNDNMDVVTLQKELTAKLELKLAAANT